MSESNDTLAVKQCFKCNQRVLNNLNIEYNSSNSMIAMWNKYQIFIYEGFNFTSPAKVFTPEYLIQSLLLTNNYLLCLDINGYVHVTTLKFKNPDQKIYKCLYLPLEQAIKVCVAYSAEESLSLKYDSQTYYLCLNKINTEYKEIKRVALNTKEYWPIQDNTRDKYILTYHKLEKCYCTILKKKCGYKIQKCISQCRLIIISFDKRTVYGCLFNPKMTVEKTDLFKLYSCASEICSIEVVASESVYILIGLKMGVVLQLMINERNICNPRYINPEIGYLNSASHKIKDVSGVLMYTDGLTMWKAENVFSKDITFKQFFVRDVNDFTICEDRIICTTFSKLIYSFSFQAEQSYLAPVQKTYYEADELLQNSDYLHKIFEEVDKSQELAKQVKIESSYVATMALAKRQHIVHQTINCSVTVRGNFEDILKENAEELTLTEDFSKYIKPGTYIICISIKMNNDDNSVFDIISAIITNSETDLQVTISNKNKTLQTTSLKMINTNYLIPLQLDEATDIHVNIQLVARIPGTYDKKQKIWNELYKNNVLLTSDQFIRTKTPNSFTCLKEVNADFEKSILAYTKQDNEFEFTNTSKSNSYIMYVRLPPTQSFDKYINCKSKILKDMLSTEEFLKSQIDVTFLVGKEVVVVSLENDGFSNPRLKVMSRNVHVTASIRHFFADMLYGDNECEMGQDFINIGFYTTVENLQKDVRNCVSTSASYEEMMPLLEKFEKEVVSMLPV